MGFFGFFGGSRLRQKLPPNLHTCVQVRIGKDYDDLERLMVKFGLLDSPIYDRIRELGDSPDALETQTYFFAVNIYAEMMRKRANTADIGEVIKLLQYSLRIHDEENPAVIALASVLLKTGMAKEAKPYVSKALNLMGNMLRQDAVPIGFANKESAEEAYDGLVLYAVEDLLAPLVEEGEKRTSNFREILSYARGLYIWSDPQLHFLVGTKENVNEVIRYFSLFFADEARRLLVQACKPDEFFSDDVPKSLPDVMAHFSGLLQMAYLSDCLRYVTYSEILEPVKTTWQVKVVLMEALAKLNFDVDPDKARSYAVDGLLTMKNLDWESMSVQQKEFYVGLASSLKSMAR